MTSENKIEEGDIVWVVFNNAQSNLGEQNQQVLRVPCATGDSWAFKELVTGQIRYVSEGCTIELIQKKP